LRQYSRGVGGWGELRHCIPYPWVDSGRVRRDKTSLSLEQQWNNQSQNLKRGNHFRAGYLSDKLTRWDRVRTVDNSISCSLLSFLLLFFFPSRWFSFVYRFWPKLCMSIGKILFSPLSIGSVCAPFFTRFLSPPEPVARSVWCASMVANHLDI